MRLQYSQTLVEYETPLVIEALNALGGTYVGIRIDTSDDRLTYAFVATSSASVSSYKRNRRDLRSLFIESELHGWWMGEPDLESPSEILTTFQDTSIESTGHLPETGYYHKPGVQNACIAILEMLAEIESAIVECKELAHSILSAQEMPQFSKIVHELALVMEGQLAAEDLERNSKFDFPFQDADSLKSSRNSVKETPFPVLSPLLVRRVAPPIVKTSMMSRSRKTTGHSYH